MAETLHKINLNEEQDRKLRALAHFFEVDPYVFIVDSIEAVCDASEMFETQQTESDIEFGPAPDQDLLIRTLVDEWKPLPAVESEPSSTYLVPLTDRQKELIDLSQFDYPGEPVSIGRKTQLSLANIFDQYVKNYPEAYPEAVI